MTRRAVRYASAAVVVHFDGARLLQHEATVRGFYAGLDDATRLAFDELFEQLRAGTTSKVVSMPEPRDFWMKRAVDDLCATLVPRVPGTATCVACATDYDLAALTREGDTPDATVTATATLCPKGHVLFNNITSLSY